MKRTILVLRAISVIGMMGVVCGGGRAAGGTFGTVLPLPGHISEIVLDEPRSLLYAANFTSGQVHVVSTASNRLISSLVIGGQPSGLAMSPDGQYLAVTNYTSFGGVPTVGSLTVINLNDLSRQNYALSSAPLGVAFGADGTAVIATLTDLERFRPAAGTLEVITTIASAGLSLPVPEPNFPRQITQANLTASGDGNYIFGVTSAFVFVYRVQDSTPTLNIRPVSTFLHPLAPPLVSASYDGSYFLAGQYLLDRQLRVMAEHPPCGAVPAGTACTDPSLSNLGSHAIDFGLRTVYSFFPQTNTIVTPAASGGSATTTVTNLPPLFLVQDADNLTVRDRLNLPERLTGRMVLGGGGRYLYGISDSGLLYLPLSSLAGMPQVRPSVPQMFFQLDFCQRTPVQQQIQINGAGDFTLATTLKGVTFSPSSGTGPAVVTVTVDFSQYAAVQGTTSGTIVVSSASGVNAPAPIAVSINVKDADQRGRIVPVAGNLVDIQADPVREQFYVADQAHNQVLVFANADLRLLGAFRTGNRPSWMTFSADRRYLLAANSSGENVTVINLDTMQSQGYLFFPWGHEPVSVAADNGTILAVVRCGTQCQAGGPSQIDQIDASLQAVYPLGRLGVYTNALHMDAALTPKADLSGIFIAEGDGNVKLWDATSQAVTLARHDVAGLRGTIAAGTNFYVAGGNLLNASLVPQFQFVDTPNAPAGFAFFGSQAVRTSAPGGVATDTGVVQRVDTGAPAVKKSPVRLAEAPLTPLTFSFLRSLAPLRNGTIVSTSTTGLVQLPGAFDAGIAVPRVAAITSAADFSSALAPGGLITIFGQNLAPETASAGAVPLPTELANMCVTVNGLRMPLLYVSPGQINAQLPFAAAGQAALVLHTPGGMSDIFYAEVPPAAPSVFQLAVSGQTGRFPAVVRQSNGQLATLSNPVRPNETIVVYATGLGAVGPPVQDGMPGPLSPLASSLNPPAVTLGGIPAPLYFAGLAPGFVGLYQLNIKVPGNAPEGMQIPLTIGSGTASTTVSLRVVK